MFAYGIDFKVHTQQKSKGDSHFSGLNRATGFATFPQIVQRN
jgi:hypothetical protein